MHTEYDRTLYGVTIPASRYAPKRSLVGSIETSGAGNVILRVGRELVPSWTQTEHVVLEPTEAIRFARSVLEHAGVEDLEAIDALLAPTGDLDQPEPDPGAYLARHELAAEECSHLETPLEHRGTGHLNDGPALLCPGCGAEVSIEEFRRAAARELLDASRAATGQKVDVERWLAAKRLFVEVVGYRPGDRVALDDLGTTRVVTLKAIEGDEAVFDLDPLHRDVRRPVSALLPITAELLVAASEVLDELEEVGS